MQTVHPTNGASVVDPSLSLLEENHRVLEGAATTKDRSLRTLPEIAGIHALSKSEIKRDIRNVESGLPAGNGICMDSKENEDLPWRKKPSKKNIVSPEEVVLNMDKCRRAVVLSKKEYLKMREERQNLLENFSHLKCQILYEMMEMEKMGNVHDKVVVQLKERLERESEKLTGRKRRTSNLNTILNEMETRGNRIRNLESENVRLKRLLNDHYITVPDDFKIQPVVGDHVQCALHGKGRVVDIDDEDGMYWIKFGKNSAVKVDSSAVQYVKPGSNVKVDRLRDRFYKLANEFCFDMDQNVVSRTSDRVANHPTQDTNEKIIYPLCPLKVTPHTVPLLLSPISSLPDHVAACGTSDYQWIPSALPKEYKQMEQDKTTIQSQKAQLLRLQAQLDIASDHRKECDRIISEQLDTINDYVFQLQHVRSEMQTLQHAESLPAKKNQNVNSTKQLEESKVPESAPAFAPAFSQELENSEQLEKPKALLEKPKVLLEKPKVLQEKPKVENPQLREKPQLKEKRKLPEKAKQSEKSKVMEKSKRTTRSTNNDTTNGFGRILRNRAKDADKPKRKKLF